MILLKGLSQNTLMTVITTAGIMFYLPDIVALVHS